MNYFKRFSDFCAVFAISAAAIYTLRKFMSFNPADAEGMVEKLKLFFSKDYYRDYRSYIVLITLLTVSLVVGAVLERFPYVGFALSLAPMLQILLMFGDGKLYERPMLYVILGIAHVLGNIVHSLYLDRADGKRRAFICVNLGGITLSALGLWVWNRAKELSLLDEEAAAELGTWDSAILAGVEDGAQSITLKLSLMILVGIAISIILRDVYFIDAAVAVIPFVYSAHLVATEKLRLFPLAIIFITLFYLIFRLLILICEPMSNKCIFSKKILNNC